MEKQKNIKQNNNFFIKIAFLFVGIYLLFSINNNQDNFVSNNRDPIDFGSEFSKMQQQINEQNKTINTLIEKQLILENVISNSKNDFVKND